MNKFKVTTEIRSLLLSSPAISALVQDKIFPLVAPTDTQGDFIIYQRDGYKTEYTKMGRYMDKPLVYVNAVSDDYDRSQEIASAIYDWLEDDFVNPAMRIRLEDSTEDYGDGKFIQVLQFSIE